jgi:uncharacterized coiled-coil DUF342 family protein
MTLRALFASCMLGLVALSAANDYDLVVPRGWDYLKSAKTLVVYSPDGAFKPGDHITRVVAGGAEGPGVRVSAGWPAANSVELGKAGAVNGFAGSIILSSDGTGANGLAAIIVPAGQGAARAPEDGLTHAIPWIWILGGAGLIVVLAGAATLFKKSSAPGAPVRFSGRKGIEEGVREIRSKIDEIQEEQKQLVRKPPVLRSFRKQIDGFEHRLKDIESSNHETQQQLSGITNLLTKLDERLNNIAQHSVNASGDSKKAIELVSKLSTEHAKRATTLEEQIQKVAATQDSFKTISRDVAKTVDSVANVASRIDALAAQNLAHENKLQATSTGIDTARKDIETVRKDVDATRKDIDSTRKDIEKLDGKLKSGGETAEATRKQLEKLETRVSVGAESAEATRKGIGELATAWQTTDRKLAGLEAQAAAAATRDSEVKTGITEVAKSSEFLEKGLLRLDTRVDELAKSNEALHQNLQKSAEALQLNLQEITGLVANNEGALHANLQGLASELGTLRSEVGTLPAAMTNLGERVSNSEGALHANLKGLASELGTLRNEVGSLPVAMTDLGERVGSLDARLAPISERGDKLAEGFLGLQSRFEDAALSLATQFQALDGRLEDIKSEGSKLANLPEVVHGNTAELASHVKSAETGLKSLGEELAKLQEALLSDNKQSGATAKEITQRLEAWESSLANVASKVEDLKTPPPVDQEISQRLDAWENSLANVASKVEDLRAPSQSEDADDDDDVVAKPKKSKKAAAREAKAKAKAEEIARADVSEEKQVLQPVAEVGTRPAEATPELTLVNNSPEAQEPSAPPELILEETAQAEPQVVEALVVEVAEEAPATEEQVIEAPAATEEEINFDEEEEDGLVLSRSKAGRWTEMAGSSERLWSVKLPGNKPLPAVKGPIRPLTPIETPGIDSGLGALICTGAGAAYVHGSALHCFWPGTETKSVILQSPAPSDLWRLMLFGGYIYCAEERQVEIIHTSTWTKHAFFTGDYINQAHTESNWVGLMAWGDQLAVDFRDTMGKHVNSPREIEASASEQTYFAASGSSAFVGTRSGSIFRVDPAGAVQLARPSDDGKLLSITITKAGILAMMLGSAGIEARLISREGHLLKIGDLGCQVMAHAPVVINDRFYIFDDCTSELITISLKTLQVIARITLDSTLGISRMVGLACGKNHFLSIMGTDDRGVCTRAFVLDVKTGQEMTLCPINHPRAEMVAGDGHLVVATSSAYQNTIQVFNPFEAVDLKQKRAA